MSSEFRSNTVSRIAIDKAKLAEHGEGGEHAILDTRAPYLLGFNYLVTYIERYVRNVLGSSARGMIILDQKPLYQEQVDVVTRHRRYEVPKVRRIKWIVEFSYPVDSVRHPMVQLSDVIIYLTRKFLECENGYRPNWQPESKNFFASCYEKISERVWRTNLIDVPGREEEDAQELLTLCQSTHRAQWRRHYDLPAA